MVDNSNHQKERNSKMWKWEIISCKVWQTPRSDTAASQNPSPRYLQHVLSGSCER